MIAFAEGRQNRYRHLIWDWNGTLLDDSQLCADIINGMLRERGHAAWSFEAHREAFDFPVRRFYERLGFDLERESFEELSETFIARYQRAVPGCGLHFGARDVLAAVRDCGCTQSILSASRQDYLDERVAQHDLHGYFIGVNGIDTIFAPGKTERGRSWVRQLDCEPDEVVLIGDTVHDAEVAAVLGCDCLLLACGAHPASKLERCGQPVYPNLASLAATLVPARAHSG